MGSAEFLMSPVGNIFIAINFCKHLKVNELCFGFIMNLAKHYFLHFVELLENPEEALNLTIYSICTWNLCLRAPDEPF